MTSTVPAKSQPLHNFALPHLKWKKNHHSNNHHRGRSAKPSDTSSSPSQVDSPLRQSQSPLLHSVHSPDRELLTPPPPPRQSPMRDQPPRQSPMRGCDSISELGKRNSAGEKWRNGALASSPDRALEKKHRVPEMDAIGQKEGRSKIVLKLPRKNKGEEVQEEPKGDEVQEDGKLAAAAAADQDASEEPVQKSWNLRPRKPIHKSLNLNGVQFKSGGSALMEDKTQSLPHRTPIRPETELISSEKKAKRPRFSIALSRDEIEDDFFALTGSKPARRPKKRSKSVQKQLDNLFPGLWLASITADSYKVSDNPLKGEDSSSIPMDQGDDDDYFNRTKWFI